MPYFRIRKKVANSDSLFNILELFFFMCLKVLFITSFWIISYCINNKFFVFHFFFKDNTGFEPITFC